MEKEPVRERAVMDQARTRLDTSTELAKQRTRAAGDRTLMAWIRTGLSLITFGLGIGKAIELIDAANPGRVRLLDPLHASLVVALGLVILGVLSLFGAILQYVLLLKALQQPTYTYKPPVSLAVVVASLLVVIGVLALVAIIIP